MKEKYIEMKSNPLFYTLLSITFKFYAVVLQNLQQCNLCGKTGLFYWQISTIGFISPSKNVMGALLTISPSTNTRFQTQFLINITIYNELEKLPPFGRLFYSSCGELQPSAANNVGPFVPNFFSFFQVFVFKFFFEIF